MLVAGSTGIRDREFPINRNASIALAGLPATLVNLPDRYSGIDGSSLSPGYMQLSESRLDVLQSPFISRPEDVSSVDMAIRSVRFPLRDVRVYRPGRLTKPSLGIGPGSSLQTAAGSIATIWRHGQQFLVIDSSRDTFARDCHNGEMFTTELSEQYAGMSRSMNVVVSLAEVETSAVPAVPLISNGTALYTTLYASKQIFHNFPASISEVIDARVRSSGAVRREQSSVSDAPSYSGCNREILRQVLPDIVLLFKSPSGSLEGNVVITSDEYVEFMDDGDICEMKYTPYVSLGGEGPDPRAQTMSISLIQIPSLNIRFSSFQIDICGALNN